MNHCLRSLGVGSRQTQIEKHRVQDEHRIFRNPQSG